MKCSDVSERLGAYLDGELPAPERDAVGAHVTMCDRCRAELEAIQAAVQPLRASGDVKAPAELWDAIEARLEAAEPVTIRLPETRAKRSVSSLRRRLRPILIAAAVLLPIGLVALFLHLSLPALAEEAVIDFRPLLSGIETNYDAAMADFLSHHKARPVPLSEAGQYLHVRVHPRDPMPYGLIVNHTHVLSLGKSRGLFFQFAGPEGRLVLSQCPVGIRKEHGDYHCMPCKLGAHPNAEAVHVGAWRLIHMPSERGCICILSTLPDEHLMNVLSALDIEF